MVLSTKRTLLLRPMNGRGFLCLVVFLTLTISGAKGVGSLAIAADLSTDRSATDNSFRATDHAELEDTADGRNAASAKAKEVTTTVSPEEATVGATQNLAREPLQGYVKRDAKGTPVVPEWKMQAGYDELLGKFYYGFAGFKLFAVNGPFREATLGQSKLKHWKGHKPFPCVLKFTKLADDSGGYYFRSVGSKTGPCGWIMPQPAEPHKVREWAIYFMQ
jgi:hypothetical protein